MDGPNPRRPDLRQARRSMWRLRWVLVGLSAILAIVLVVSGAVVIGLIIGAMAVVRTVMLARYRPGRGDSRAGRPF